MMTVLILWRLGQAEGPHEVPPPQPVPPMPAPGVPGIELPNNPTVPPGSPEGPDIQDPPPQQPVPVREPTESPPEHAR